MSFPALYSRNMANNSGFALARNAMGFRGCDRSDIIMNNLRRTAYGAMEQDASRLAKDNAKQGFTLDFCA